MKKEVARHAVRIVAVRERFAKAVRRTATLGDRPLRICRDCRRKFTVQRLAKTRA